MTGGARREPDRWHRDPTDWLSIACGLVGVLLGSAIVIGILDRAWLDCAGDIEAGGRFAVRFELWLLFAPVTLLAIGVGVLVPTFALRKRSVQSRIVVAAASLLATMVIILAWAVPHPFGSYRVESADGPTPACRSDSVPAWWPFWLPS